jgi:hypothetical protein
MLETVMILLVLKMLPFDVCDFLVGQQPYLRGGESYYMVLDYLIWKVRIMTLGSSVPLDIV